MCLPRWSTCATKPSSRTRTRPSVCPSGISCFSKMWVQLITEFYSLTQLNIWIHQSYSKASKNVTELFWSLNHHKHTYYLSKLLKLPFRWTKWRQRCQTLARRTFPTPTSCTHSTSLCSRRTATGKAGCFSSLWMCRRNIMIWWDLVAVVFEYNDMVRSGNCGVWVLCGCAGGI